MATLSVDAWALTTVTLDLADGYVPNLIAHESDADGRGIDLYITQDGQAASMSGMTVNLEWVNRRTGHQGYNKFTAVSATTGHFKLYYPTAMQEPGTVLARISIYLGGTTPISGSLNFEIYVQPSPINQDAQIGSDDFTQFQEAVRDLNELGEEVRKAEDARVEAENKRVTAESSRASAESTRVANENARKTAETARATAESKRETAESSRETAEAARVKAEQERVAAEQSRSTAFSQAIQESQTATGAANQAASTAQSAAVAASSAADTANAAAQRAEDGEEAREAAEKTRQANEQTRQSQESARQTAETKRETAETARANAEKTRESQESARQTAEQQRAEAEAERQKNFKTITSTTIAYQGSTSGTSVPSGEWSESIPEVPNGQYLWTRVLIGFNQGDPVYAYSVSYVARDGGGIGVVTTELDGLAPKLSGNADEFFNGVGEYVNIPKYSNATPQTDGLMSAEDKAKLDKIHAQVVWGDLKPVTTWGMLKEG
jgi:hypothetical protein